MPLYIERYKFLSIGDYMYILKSSNFKREITRGNGWYVDLDITQLKDFSALEKYDLQVLSMENIVSRDTIMSLYRQGNTEFKVFDEGKRIPVILRVDAFKLGRIIAKNDGLVEFEDDCGNIEVSQLITDGVIFEYSQEKANSSLLATRTFKFKVKYGAYNENVSETSQVDRGSQTNIQIWV